MMPIFDVKTNTWTFPAGWEASAQKAWIDGQAAIAAERAKAAQASTDAAVAASGPDAMLLAMRVQLEDERRASAAAERDAVDEKAWREAQAEHPASCARIYTGGGWLILRAQTAAEWETIQAQARGVARSFLEQGDDARASKASESTYREGLLTKSIIHPPTIEARRVIVAKYHGVWPELYATRDALNRGPTEAAGKGASR